MSDAPISNRAFATAIGYTVAAAFFLSVTALLAKLLSGYVIYDAMMFLRFAVPFLILGFIIWVVLRQPSHLGDWRVHAVRSFFALLAQYALFYYLIYGNLLMGTLLFASSGLFMPLVSWLVFRTTIRPRAMFAIMTGFTGVGLVLAPTGGISWLELIGLSSGFFNACSQVANHFGAKKLGPLPATLGMFGYALAGSVLVTLTCGQGPATWASIAAAGGSVWFWLIVVGVSLSTICNQGLRARAFVHVNKPSSTAPFYYASAVFGAGWDWLLYREVPAWHVILGTALVLAGAVIMARRGKASV